MAWKVRRNQQGFAQEFVSTEASPWAADLPEAAGGAQMYETDAPVVRMASWPNPGDYDPSQIHRFRPSGWYLKHRGAQFGLGDLALDNPEEEFFEEDILEEDEEPEEEERPMWHYLAAAAVAGGAFWWWKNR